MSSMRLNKNVGYRRIPWMQSGVFISDVKICKNVQYFEVFYLPYTERDPRLPRKKIVFPFGCSLVLFMGGNYYIFKF